MAHNAIKKRRLSLLAIFPLAALLAVLFLVSCESLSPMLSDAASYAEAMHLMSLAGYEPSSLLDMLQVLEKEQGSHPGGFNSTHPAPAQRIDNAQRLIGQYDVQDTRSYRQTRYKKVL